MLATPKRMKQLSLVLLAVQNCSQMLMMRASRTGYAAGEKGYAASTAVIMQELIKLCIGFALMMLADGKSFAGAIAEVHRITIGNPLDMLKMSVPGILYTIQNNLLYVATSNLDAASTSVLYQLKILTTALFSVSMLGRQLPLVKWGALGLLAVGAALVQLSQDAGSGGTAASPEASGTAAAVGAADEVAIDDVGVNQGNPFLGFVAVVCACMTSGFSGVYFEKILKARANKDGSAPVSLWARNVQLGMFGVVFGFGALLAKDASDVMELGFFHGYTPLVWLVVLDVSCGGLLVAVVVKYADNIAKGFATSVSIIMSTLISSIFLGFAPSMGFMVGAGAVIGATVLYSQPDPPQEDRGPADATGAERPRSTSDDAGRRV